jgi:hypothetical protein
MRTRLPAIFVTLILLGLAPIVAPAQSCGDYPLTDAQRDYLLAQQLEITVPEGELPIIQRCDVDGNLSVDINDIRAISRARNQPAAHPQDPMDWDRNGQIRPSRKAASSRRPSVSRPRILMVTARRTSSACTNTPATIRAAVTGRSKWSS